MLFSKFGLVIMARLMHNQGGKLPDAATQSKMLAWYAHAGMWGRYAGSTETFLAQDLEAVDAGGADGLLAVIRQSRGDLTVRSTDFAGSTLGSRFYPTLYMLTRTQAAKDFGTGVTLSASLLGHLSSLDVHHIFPKAQLYKLGFERHEVNAVANFCFLTKQTNISIGAKDPAVYLRRIEDSHPGALASQWVPTDQALWDLDQFPTFLSARRELLAKAANDFMAALEGAGVAAQQDLGKSTGAELNDPTEGVPGDLKELIEWMVAEGFAAPETDVEVADPETGFFLCTAEALWADGLQVGIGSPVVLEVDESHVEDDLTARGYLVFTSIEALRDYAQRVSSEQGT